MVSYKVDTPEKDPSDACAFFWKQFKNAAESVSWCWTTTKDAVRHCTTPFDIDKLDLSRDYSFYAISLKGKYDAKSFVGNFSADVVDAKPLVVAASFSTDATISPGAILFGSFTVNAQFHSYSCAATLPVRMQIFKEVLSKEVCLDSPNGNNLFALPSDP
jgi:hypothetical protein